MDRCGVNRKQVGARGDATGYVGCRVQNVGSSGSGQAATVIKVVFGGRKGKENPK